MIIGHWRIRKPVERGKALNIISYFFIVCMENMGPILMNMNALDLFSIHIAGNMSSFINYNTFISRICQFPGTYCAI